MNKLLVLLLAFAIFSCKNEEDILRDTGNSKDARLQSSFEFDSIGIYHNQVMNEFISNKLSFTDICDSSSFMNNFFDELSEAYCSVGYSSPSSNCDTIVESLMRSSYSIMLSAPTYSSYFEQTIAYNKIDDLLTMMTDYNTDDIDSILNEIQIWTEDVSISSSYTVGDKDKLLKCGSIAYHSLDYWYKAYTNVNSPWHFISNCNQNKTENKIMFISWYEALAIGVADVKGFMVGGPVGATTGSASCAVYIFWGSPIRDWLEGAWDTVSGWF